MQRNLVLQLSLTEISWNWKRLPCIFTCSLQLAIWMEVENPLLVEVSGHLPDGVSAASMERRHSWAESDLRFSRQWDLIVWHTGNTNSSQKLAAETFLVLLLSFCIHYVVNIRTLLTDCKTWPFLDRQLLYCSVQGLCDQLLMWRDCILASLLIWN